MAFPIDTKLVSFQLTPEVTPGGLHVFRATIIVETHIGPIPEQVTFSVVVESKDRGLGVITYEAMGRAATIIAGLNASPQRSPSHALDQWANAANF